MEPQRLPSPSVKGKDAANSMVCALLGSLKADPLFLLFQRLLMQVTISENLSCKECYPAVFWLGFFFSLSVDMLPQLLAYHVPTFNTEERRGTTE